jgi:hypothetical protein
MASKANLVIDQGATFSTTLNLQDQNSDTLSFTGYTGISSLKKWYTSANSTPFNVTVNANTGTITLAMNASTTASIYAGRYVYDVSLTDSSNNVSRIVEGIVTVTPAVTAGIFVSSNNIYSSNSN